MIEAPPARYTARTITETDALLNELAKVRAQGIALDRGERADDLIGIAGPVRNARGKVIAGAQPLRPRAAPRPGSPRRPRRPRPRRRRPGLRQPRQHARRRAGDDCYSSPPTPLHRHTELSRRSLLAMERGATMDNAGAMSGDRTRSNWQKQRRESPRSRLRGKGPGWGHDRHHRHRRGNYRRVGDVPAGAGGRARDAAGGGAASRAAHPARVSRG